MGTIIQNGSITAHPSSYDTAHYSYASISSSYPITQAYTDSSSTTYAQVSWKTGSNAETYVYLKFDLSAIPEGATITSVSAKAKGYVNTTNSSRVTTRQMQLATGTTLKGSALTISNSTSAQTFSNVGTWTRAELLDAGVRFYVKRGTSNTSSTYQLRLYGADITVEYTYEETSYSITVSNSTSATVTASPDEVIEGGSSVIKASSVTGITITDNGADVTSQFTQRQDTAESYSVTNISSTYGFEVNGNGYYESNNQGHSSSAAVCRIDLHLPVAATVTFSLINYAESTYDYGLLSNVDTDLSTTASADTSDVYWSGQNHNSSSVQTVTYTISAGDHYIYAKYFKDNYTDDGNDSLQFKVAITLNEPFTPGEYWGYDITNIQANHTIVVTTVATDILWVRGSSSVIISKTLNDSGIRESWSDLNNLTLGNSYHFSGFLHGYNNLIAPSHFDEDFVWTADVTFDSENLSVQLYDGNILIDNIPSGVSGIYGTIEISSATWQPAIKAYKKVNGSWVEQTDLTTVFDSSKNYVKG